MRLFFINALLLLATTSTLAIPVALPGEGGSISLHKHVPGAVDKHAVASSISSALYTPGDAGPDNATLVRRVRSDGRPSTSGLRPKKSSVRKPRKKIAKSKQWTHKKKKKDGGGGGGDAGGGGGAAGGGGIAAGA